MTKHKQPLPKVVSPAEWQDAIDKLLVKEKELTRLRDALNAERRRLPMVKIDKEYVFEGDKGEVNLLDLWVRISGQSLDLSGPDAIRSPGNLGGFAGRLAADRTV